MAKEIREYDKKNRLIHFKHSSGREYWCEFDENDNFVYHKTSTVLERMYKYDKYNRYIHYIDFDKEESWYKLDKNNNKIKITKEKFDSISFPES